MRVNIAVSGLSAARGFVIMLLLGASFPASATQAPLNPARINYLGQCGGCHGLQGDTAPAPVPVLRGRIGYFMRSVSGREYLIRLPNVSRAKIDDDALAAMMNFVVAAFGPYSGPAKTRLFSADEVRRLRNRAMFGAEIELTRRSVVNELVRDHGAPASLQLSYPGQAIASRH